MRTIYLIRHAMPDLPLGERWCIGGRTDLPLGALGRMQAALLSFEPRLKGLSAVFCSPLRRSAETAAAFSPHPIPVRGLEEQDMGEWDGLPFREIQLRFPDLYAARGGNPDLLPPGAEPLSAVRARMERSVLTCARRCDRDCAIVSLTGQRNRLGYGSLSVLETDGAALSVRAVGLLSRPPLTAQVCEALLSAAGADVGAAREIEYLWNERSAVSPEIDLLRRLSPEARTGAAWMRALGYDAAAEELEQMKESGRG